ncbi:hypothetical protein [Streptomyces sp. LN549]|uniref:hypothetical protein n=1 Tax=Streptomyces sp. LN549 TaxID=3112979 RepID=UPI00371648BB
MHFGFRMEGNDILVAYPICPSEAVFGAQIVVSVDGPGRGDGFETRWRATGPRSDAVRRGVFVVGSGRSFETETKPLTKRLPKAFYVDAILGTRGHEVKGDEGSVDVDKLKSVKLGADEYRTSRGKTMTRAQINAQRTCPTKTG